MAANKFKEAMVIILDVGKTSERDLNSSDVAGSEDNFLQKQKDCCMKLLQRKIFAAKKDEVALLVSGTNETDNQLNQEMSDGAYKHISEAVPMSIPNWDMVRALDKNVNYEGASSDWLDSVIVAMDILRKEEQAKKFGFLKILLLSKFTRYVNDANVSFVIEGLKNMKIELIVISDNLEISDDGDEGVTQRAFSQQVEKNNFQRQSENLLQRIIDETDGILSNFDDALRQLMEIRRKKARPWYWYCNLTIGTKISIQIAAAIMLKEENHIKWSTESIHENTICHKVVEHFANGEQIEPDKTDMIKGFMLGSTPLPYDESLGIDARKTEKCLQCLTFTSRHLVLPEYLTGNGCYIVLPKKGQNTSEKLFAALVNAMASLNMVMIARRVYNNGNKPKLMALKPSFRERIPCLIMYEMVFEDQVLSFAFPPLTSKKHEPTKEQYEVVDELISSMNLKDAFDDVPGREAFSQKNLTNISLQYIYDTVSKKALNPSEPVENLDKRLDDALQIPKKIVNQSADILKRIQNIFPLEEKKKPERNILLRHLHTIPSQPDVEGNIMPDIEEVRSLLEVGSVTPAEDLLALLNRGEHFGKIGRQIENVISDLVFKSLTQQTEKVLKAIVTYREMAKVYVPFQYNSWITSFKDAILSRKKTQFWKDVIVREKLGLISSSESEQVSSVTLEDAEEFYLIGLSSVADNAASTNQGDVDDLFGMM